MNNFKQKLKNTFLVDITYPRFCLRCRSRLARACIHAHCKSCLQSLPVLVGKICLRCAEFHQNFSANVTSCANCSDVQNFYEFAVCGAPLRRRLREFVYKVKYEQRAWAAEALADYALAAWQEKRMIHLRKILRKEKFLLLPVPLHKNKQRLRGYNQALLITQALLKRIKADDADVRIELADCLNRLKNTASQTLLDRKSRQKQLNKAFEIKKSWLKNSDRFQNSVVIIIDDVLTTGSTINECAKTLTKQLPKDKMPKKILGLTCARA